MNAFKPIKSLSELNPNKLKASELMRIFTTKKKYLVKTDDKIHLTNDPKRLVMERYKIDEALDISIYDLTK